MKKVRDFIRNHWRHIGVGVVVVLVCYFLIFFNASSLAPGFSSTEVSSLKSSSSLDQILRDPLNVLYKLAVFIPLKLGSNGIQLTRLVAGVIATASIGLFYFITYSLFNQRTALFSSILFATSSGFLHSSHLGTPLILQIFGIVTLLALLPMYLISKNKMVALYVIGIALAVTLYIPGMFWFIVIGAAVLNKRIVAAFRTLSLKHRVIIGTLFLLVISPLVWAGFKNPSIALNALALSDTLPTWSTIGERALRLGKSVVWSGQGPAEIMLVGAPLFTVVELGLLFIGLSLQLKRPRLKSNYFVLGATLFAILLILFGGELNYVTLTPIFSLLMAGGLFYLNKQWNKVFPVNPVAHIAGTVLACVLIMAPVLYHTRAFFVAWPHSIATHNAFSKAEPERQAKQSETTQEELFSPTF